MCFGLFVGPLMRIIAVSRAMSFEHAEIRGSSKKLQEMGSKFLEPILNQPITQLDFGVKFKLICELAGFYSLADLLERHTSELLKFPGFSYHVLTEYIDFLELKHLAHYVDAE